MRRLVLGTVCLLIVGLGACTNRAAEMLETARFEEQQQNLEHARELYGRIASEHPDSPEAKTARERLAALDAVSR